MMLQQGLQGTEGTAAEVSGYPDILHGATVRAPSVIPHTAWDHPGRAEACGGSDGVVVVARERSAPPFPIAQSDNSDSPRTKVAGEKPRWSTTGKPTHSAAAGAESRASHDHLAETPGQPRAACKTVGVANLGTRQRLHCPDSLPKSYPASHLMAPPLQRNPEAASGSAQLPTYFPFRLSWA